MDAAGAEASPDGSKRCAAVADAAAGLPAVKSSSAEAAAWGLVNYVHPDAELPGAVRTMAARLLSMDPLSLSSTKRACAALANAMVPKEVTWSDAEMMLLAHRQQALRRDG